MNTTPSSFTTPGQERVGDGPVAGILINDVTRVFGGREAVSHVTLEINKGEFFSLLGPSGCGKTTTLRMLSGLDFPSSGSIALANEDITDTPANKRSVHTVFQNYALFPHMSVYENVAYGLKNRGLSKQEISKRVGTMLDLVELRGQGKVSPGSLSGGMQQRVALARALVLKPQALLLDEPLGALDMRLRQHMQTVLRRIHREVGITFVYVTHDQTEAFAMSDRIGVMSAGRLLQVATPEELYRHPMNDFVARFLGASSRISARITHCNADGTYQISFEGEHLASACPGVPGLRPGQEIQAVIRPENTIATQDYEQAGTHPLDGDLALDAKVSNSVFMGSHYLLSLTTPVGADIIAHLPSNAPAAQPGDRVQVRWHPRDMWAVPMQQESTRTGRDS